MATRRVHFAVFCIAAICLAIFPEKKNDSPNRLKREGVTCAEEHVELSDEEVTFYTALGIFLTVCFIALVLYCAEAKVKPRRGVPPWVNTIQPDPVLAQGCMDSCSDGITILEPTLVMRHRTGTFEVDGARWSVPLSKGKHVFEIYWPCSVRGILASVGVGTTDAPLFVKPKETLVGFNRNSWGIDIGRRKVVHNKQLLETMPKAGPMPDMFFMYVDCDSRTVGFGTTVEYFGAPLSFPSSALPVYVLVGILQPGSQVRVTYRGSEVKQVQPVANTLVVGPQDSVTVVTGNTVTVVK